MPWIIGNENAVRALAPPPTFALTSLWDQLSEGGAPTYVGYLLEGVAPDLAAGRFLPGRVGLAFRAGWSAVAPALRVEDETLASAFGPFLAPTAPRPHGKVPLGVALFSRAGLMSRLGDQVEGEADGLTWARRLALGVSATLPVFCDPILELRLVGRTAREAAACPYRPPAPWRRAASALSALALSGGEAG